MVAPFGGELPLLHQDGRLTVEPPDGTSSTSPVLPGQVFALAIAADTAADSSGYKLVAATAAATPATAILCEALSGSTDVKDEVSALVLSGYAGTVRRLQYKTGGAPTLGQSIAVAAGTGTDLRKIAGKAWARGEGTVVKVDTSTETVEVLI